MYILYLFTAYCAPVSEVQRPFRSICVTHPGVCKRQEGVFPEESATVENYVSMYKDNHSVEALYENMDLSTPEAQALQEIENENFNPPAVDTVGDNSELI